MKVGQGNNEVTRIGIVGCGYVSSFYMDTIREYPSLELIGAYDSIPMRTQMFSEFYKVKKYDSLKDLVNDCDLIVNLTTPENHFEVSKTALMMGRAVYSEKPFAISNDDAERLVQIAIDNKTNILSAPAVHMSPMAETVALQLKNNLVGKIYAVYAEMDDDQVHLQAYENWTNNFGIRWPAKNEFESGATLEHAAYTLCLLNKWFGLGEVKSVYQNECIKDKVIPVHKKTADFSCAVIEYPQGVVARLTCSIVAPKNHEIVIVGEKGVLTIKNIWFFDSPIYWQNYFTLRSNTRLNPIKRRVKTIGDTFPLGKKSPVGQMDFCRGIYDLSLKEESNPDLMHASANINKIVLAMNGESTSEPQSSWIILGTGNMAVEMFNCFYRNGYSVDLVYSSKTHRAKEIAALYGIKDSADSIEAIPTSTGRATAYVASINEDHYHQVVGLLNKGYDVLCEKPLTMSYEQTRALFELADSKGLRLQENMWSLFVPAAKVIKAESEPFDHVELVFSSPIPFEKGSRQWTKGAGGCLYDLGIYPLAWSVFLFGDITEYVVESATVEHEVVSELVILTTHSGGKTAKIKTGFHAVEHHIKLGDNYYTPIYAPEYKSGFKSAFLRKVKNKLTAIDYPAKDPYAYIIDSMNRSESKIKNSMHPKESTLHLAKVMEDIYKSILSGQ